MIKVGQVRLTKAGAPQVGESHVVKEYCIDPLVISDYLSA